jgi:hypothetical protein
VKPTNLHNHPYTFKVYIALYLISQVGTDSRHTNGTRLSGSYILDIVSALSSACPCEKPKTHAALALKARGIVIPYQVRIRRLTVSTRTAVSDSLVSSLDATVSPP